MTAHPHSLRLLHTAMIPLRWADMDSFGHVNNVMYLRLMEQARIEWFDTLGPNFGMEDDAYVLVARVECNFRMETKYPGSVEVRTYLQKIGRTSITLHQEIRLAGDASLRADGASTLAFRNDGGQGAIPVPDIIGRLKD